MARASPELEAVIRRFLKAIEIGDLETVRALIDSSDQAMVIGSDPEEWFKGPEAVELLKTSIEHRRNYAYDIKRLEAFEEGTVGWVALDVLVLFEPGDAGQTHLKDEPVPLHITAVLVLDQGFWRIIQWHVSVPSPDDPDVVGTELSEAVSEMMRALDEESEVSALTSKLQTNTVSLVFTDIVDSTLRAGETTDEAWSDLITRHLAEIEHIAARNDGFVVKTTGDGAMLAFSSARKAVQAGVELMRSPRTTDSGAPLRLRIGVHTGEAVKTNLDYFGQTVNLAARVMAAAGPDQILVSDLVRNLVGDMPEVEFDAPVTVELKGIPGRHKVHPVLPRIPT